MQTITSRDNSLLRQARAVRDGKADDLIFIEGLRLSEEALRSGLTIASVIVSDELARKEKARELIHELGVTTDRAAVVSEKLLESISYTSTPQGINSDRKSTRLNSSHGYISYAVFCLKKKNNK